MYERIFQSEINIVLIFYAGAVWLISKYASESIRRFFRDYWWWISIGGSAGVAYMVTGRTDITVAYAIIGALGGFIGALAWSVEEKNRNSSFKSGNGKND
jgi:hypothetical protein